MAIPACIFALHLATPNVLLSSSSISSFRRSLFCIIVPWPPQRQNRLKRSYRHLRKSRISLDSVLSNILPLSVYRLSIRSLDLLGSRLPWTRSVCSGDKACGILHLFLHLSHWLLGPIRKKSRPNRRNRLLLSTKPILSTPEHP